MRIGLVTDFYYPWIGGPATVVRNLGHGLAARGHSVSVLAPSASGPETWETEGALEICRVGTVPLPFGYRLRAVARPSRPVTRWLAHSKLDVVHVHHPFPLSACAVYEAASMGVPVVATNHTIPECSLWGVRRLGPLYKAGSRSFGWWIVQLLSRCSQVATPTDTAARALRELGYTGYVRTISNGVDTHRFSPGPARPDLRARLGLDGRPVVLYTGRLDAEKQMDVWLRAAAKVTSVSDAQFLIGGQGTDRSRLERLAQALGMGSRLHFIGYLEENEFPDVYRLADVYFITSPVELQSIATLEAMASGLPVVAVNAGALPELVHHNENGRLVPTGDWKAAADELLALLRDAESRRRMAARSRKLSLEHDMHRSIDAYERFLVQGAGSKRQSES